MSPYLPSIHWYIVRIGGLGIEHEGFIFGCGTFDVPLADIRLQQNPSYVAIGAGAPGNERNGVKKMKRNRILGLVLAAACVLSLLSGCGSKETASDSDVHAPISICNPFRDVSAFIEVVHKYYPEINFEVLPYAGANGTAYMQGQLRSGVLPDVYVTSVYLPGQYDSADKLLDLAGYDFTDNYVQSRLREVAAEDGAIYMLPSFFNAIGITYNKRILKENGWALPTSLKEMEELAPKVREAGYTFCLNQLQFPGYGFQYLCNILDTGFLNTMAGRHWQSEFLNGEANFSDMPEMVENLQLLQRWRDLGLLTGEGNFKSDAEVEAEMAKGNTLFMLGSSNNFRNYDVDMDDFGLMPYLSENGDQNIFMLNTGRYTGLSKTLAEPGNEQKLEDALHVMEVLSTAEGMAAMNSFVPTTSLSPLKDAPVVEGTYYSPDVLEQINAGCTAPFIYAGWENVVVVDGEAALSFIRGEIDLDQLTAALDESQKALTDDSVTKITTVTETISTEDCARLVGTVFAKASGADLALISLDEWFPEDHDDGNKDGVSGQLFPLPITDQEITSVLPTGWRGNIETYTLTGQRIQELLDSGYNYKDKGFFYPYQLVAPDGFTLDSGATYTVTICGASDAVKEEGKVQDTGILGLDAVRDYMSRFDSFSAKDIRWE